MRPGGGIWCGQVRDNDDGERDTCVGVVAGKWWWWWGFVEDLGARENGGRSLRFLASLRRNRDSSCSFGLELFAD